MGEKFLFTGQQPASLVSLCQFSVLQLKEGRRGLIPTPLSASLAPLVSSATYCWRRGGRKVLIICQQFASLAHLSASSFVRCCRKMAER
jgi:hypothetical protein